MSQPLTCASLAPYASKQRNFQCVCRSTKPFIGNECPDCRCAPPKVLGPINTYSVSFTIKASTSIDALHALMTNLRNREDKVRQRELYELFQDGLAGGDNGPAILEIDEYGRDERV